MGVEWQDLFRLQVEQQELIHGDMPDPALRRALAHKLAVAAQGELHDYLDAAAYKDFFPSREKPRETKLLELVDALKYILGAAWAEGFVADEVLNAFIDKTRTVRQRWEQRHLLGPKFCALDIDGVLAQHNAWEPDEAAFVASGGIRTLQPMDGAQEVTALLKANGWTILVVTSRKKYWHGRLEADTRHWLAEQNIPFDALFFAHDKAQALKDTGVPVSFMVDDSPKHVIDCSEVVDVAFLMQTQFAAPQCVNVRDWEHLSKELEGRGYVQRLD